MGELEFSDDAEHGVGEMSSELGELVYQDAGKMPMPSTFRALPCRSLLPPSFEKLPILEIPRGSITLLPPCPNLLVFCCRTVRGISFICG